MIWVGKLGSASVAGVGVAGMAVMAVNGLQMGLFTGLRALVARFVGAGDTGSANHVAQQALVIGISLSVILALIGVFLAEQPDDLARANRRRRQEQDSRGDDGAENIAPHHE